MNLKHLPILICAGCASTVDLSKSDGYLASANYYQAYWAISDARDRNPEDPVIERRYWEVRVTYLLSQAQELVFQDREVEALPIFERVLVLDPGNEAAPKWIHKCKEKLAARAVDRADKLALGGELTEALRSYNQAEEYMPGLEQVEAGIARLSEEWERERQQARERYLQGVRELADRQFAQADYQMAIALEKDPLLKQAREQREIALQRIAERRFGEAKILEEFGYFAPALKDYLFVQEIAPTTPGLAERISRMRTEVAAQEKLNAGETALLRKDFSGARQLLEEALKLTVYQDLEIADSLRLVTIREMDVAYLAARDFEIQYDFERALSAFRDIEERFSGFKDVRSRVSDLEASIEAAKASYEEGVAAEAEGRVADAVQHYGDALLFWPGYQDLDARIAELTKGK